MSYYMVDVEADGPVPGTDMYSMVAIGAVVVEPSLQKTFHRTLRPISKKWIPDALAVSGFTREECENFEDPKIVMQEFKAWIEITNQGKYPIFISDNNGFDFAYVNWYFHHFLGNNPFGFSSRNLGDIFKGLTKNMLGLEYGSFKYLRQTKHDHNPVNDAMGNAEAFIAMKERFGLQTGTFK